MEREILEIIRKATTPAKDGEPYRSWSNYAESVFIRFDMKKPKPTVRQSRTFLRKMEKKGLIKCVGCGMYGLKWELSEQTT